MIYYAHSNEQEISQWQSVYTHLENTAHLAKEIGNDSGLSQFASIAAWLHDIGKYSLAFQKKITGKNVRVDHSTAGAQEVVKLFNTTPKQKAFSTLLSYCIAGHHGGLPDFGTVIDVETDATLHARWKRPVENYQDYAFEINPSSLNFPDTLPIRPIRQFPGFSIAFMTRMIYSILVDADFLETENFMAGQEKSRGGYPDLQILCTRFNAQLVKFEHPKNAINRQRTETLKACILKGQETPGVFTLTVPTGGGKTLASMAFALNHAVHHGMKRIIYVIPYTSIIEQNAAIFKEYLGAENVLEHHSNFDWNPKNNNQAGNEDCASDYLFERLKLATENWDIPIVVTTGVQFFESLFANRSSRCRKLHNLTRSVIIFDEAQMLPRDYLQPCIYALEELVRNYGSTAILCTATQPSLGQFFPDGRQTKELITDPKRLYDVYKRTQVQFIGKTSDDALLQRLNGHFKVLCIVNTRKHAKRLFMSLESDGRFHLSTLMCPVHRKETIAAIHKRLKSRFPCRVVSTQIMEAGIDVDFPVGYRALAGVDSIIQAAGRVNRERKRKSGNLFVFEPDSPTIKRTPMYIQQGAKVAMSILRNYPDPISLEAIESYYQELYGLQDRQSFDTKKVLACFDKGTGELDFDFKTAAEKFKLIEDSTIPIVIPYNIEAKTILEKVRFGYISREISRKLQQFTVNIFNPEFEALESMGLIDVYNNTNAVLNNMEYYSPDTGLIIPETTSGNALFFS